MVVHNNPLKWTYPRERERERERGAIKTDKKKLYEVLLYANSSDSDLPQRFKKKKKHKEEGSREGGRAGVGKR